MRRVAAFVLLGALVCAVAGVAIAASRSGTAPAARRVPSATGATTTTAPPPSTTTTAPPGPPTTSVPPTSTSVPPTTPTTLGKTGVVADCETETATPLDVEPTSIVISCADDGFSLVDLAWRTWGATSASAKGTLRANLCTPDCADGTFVNYPATVTLSRVVDGAEGPTFTLATLQYTGGGPHTSTGSALDQFTLWYPGG